MVKSQNFLKILPILNTQNASENSEKSQCFLYLPIFNTQNASENSEKSQCFLMPGVS